MKRTTTAFMFTDIEGSTRLWEMHADAMGENIRRHDEIVDQLIADHGGKVVDHAGDGVFAVFPAGDPLRCTLAIQQRLQAESWNGIDELRVRIAVHAGELPADAADFRGPLANSTARIMSAAWGGQILVTPEAAAAFPVPDGARLEERGEHLLRNLAVPQAILELVHPALALESFPPLRSLSSFPNNLAPQPNVFVDRGEEFVQLSRILEEPRHRLLTLTGPGGIGKTRLAIELAGELIERFPSGVYFVPLASSSPELMVSAIADVLRFKLYSEEESRVQLARYLRAKKMLLILDNFEHLMAATEHVLFFLRETVEPRIIVTSRERLDVRGEVVFSVAGLKHSADLRRVADSDACRLFVERALLVRPGHTWSGDDERQIVRLCHLLEGIPLAIELAAAWVQVLSCEEIADEIERNLDFLSASSRDVPERHHSLRAVFDYSWGLIGPEEAKAFRRLSVFRGGFDHRAAQEVADVGMHQMRALIGKSLVVRSADRFSIHEMLRQFGEEKLRADPDEQNRIRRRHGEYYTAFLRRQRPALRGEGLKAAVGRIKSALENVRAAWSWALEQGELEPLDRCLEDAIIFFETQSRMREGMSFFDAIVRHLAVSPAEAGIRSRLLGMALAARGLFRVYLARYEETLLDTERALAILRRAGLATETGYCLYVRASAKHVMGDYEESEKLYLESIAVFDEIEDRYRATHSRIAYAQLHAWLGRTEEARRLYARCIAECHEAGDVWAKTIAQCLLGELELEHGHAGSARQRVEESLAVLRELGDQRWIVRCLTTLARLAFQSGEHDLSRRLAEEGVAITEEIRDLRKRAECLILLGRLEAQGAAGSPARRLFLQALEISRESQDTPLLLETLLRLAETGLVDGAARSRDLVAQVAAHPACRQSTLRDAETLQRRPPGSAAGRDPTTLASADLDGVVDELLRTTMTQPTGDSGDVEQIVDPFADRPRS